MHGRVPSPNTGECGDGPWPPRRGAIVSAGGCDLDCFIFGDRPMHDHDHAHPDDEASPLPEIALRVKALESILVEKGYLDPASIDVIVETYETKVGPRNGARVVAKAWSDAGYLERLRSDATAAIAELGFTGRQGEHMRVVENTAPLPNQPGRHNLVVCTLCSCYPWSVLGLPPVWYKAAPYRAKAVIDPKGVLADF